jgi:hypothetical protein
MKAAGDLNPLMRQANSIKKIIIIHLKRGTSACAKNGHDSDQQEALEKNRIG